MLDLLDSWDPNSLTGPKGVGLLAYVAPAVPLEYLIAFENDGNAPAITVTLNETIDNTFDLSTLQLLHFGFGNYTFDIPPGLSAYQQRLTVTSTLQLEVLAYLDCTSRQLQVQLQAIDPTTGLPPTQPTSGFLPPNPTNGTAGQGFFSYSIEAVGNSKNITMVSAQVSIVFDSNAVIATPRVTNAVDGVAPTFSGTLSLSAVNNTLWIMAPNISDVGSGVASVTAELVLYNGSISSLPFQCSSFCSASLFVDIWSQIDHLQSTLLIADAVGNHARFSLCSNGSGSTCANFNPILTTTRETTTTTTKKETTTTTTTRETTTTTTTKKETTTTSTTVTSVSQLTITFPAIDGNQTSNQTEWIAAVVGALTANG